MSGRIFEHLSHQVQGRCYVISAIEAGLVRLSLAQQRDPGVDLFVVEVGLGPGDGDRLSAVDDEPNVNQIHVQPEVAHQVDEKPLKGEELLPGNDVRSGNSENDVGSTNTLA